MKCFSLFSGIGGFDLALRNQGHEITGACEIDKYARSVYAKQFPGVKIWENATKINPQELPDFEILCAGFPCQAFSIAGKRRGFDDTRGSLFFEIARIAKEKRPSILFLENVKGLLSHDKGQTFLTIIRTLDEMGYNVQWQIINSKHFVPQNRERVFIIGHSRGQRTRQIFPIGTSNKINGTSQKKTQEKGERVRGQYSGTIDANYAKGGGSRTLLAWSSSGRKNFRESRIKINESNTLSTGEGCRNQSSANYVMLTERRTEESKLIRKEMRKTGLDWSPRRGKELIPRNDNIANCITAGQSNERFLTNGTRIRRLTPLECERLQGFPDNWTKGISDSQRYKCVGNAVTVPVVEFIVKELFN